MRWIYWMIGFGFIGSTRTTNGSGLPESEKASYNGFDNMVVFLSLKEMEVDSTNKKVVPTRRFIFHIKLLKE